MSNPEGAAGTSYRALDFTNRTNHPCVLWGFPGISYVGGDDGHQIGAAAYREGTKGAPVTLNPEESAHAMIGFVNIDNYDPAVCRPEEARGLRIYLPQETRSEFFALSGVGCSNPNIPGNQLTVRTVEPGLY